MHFFYKISISVLVYFLSLNTYGIELNLTEKEKTWIDSHKEIQLGAITGWPPYNFYDSDGRFTGIAAEIFKRIERNTNLKFKYVKGDWDDLRLQIKTHKIDILSAVYYTEQRADYMLFTRPYSELRDFIFTRKDRDDIQDIESIKRIAVVKGFSQAEIIQSKYPKIKIIWYDSMIAALNGVIAGHADAYIGSIASVSYLISSKHLVELKAAAPTGWPTVDVSMAVNNQSPELLGILNKAIRTISEQELNKINQQWFALEHENYINSKLLWSIVAISIILLLIAAIWLYTLRREVRARIHAENQMRIKEQQLRQALKMDALGKLTGGIAHDYNNMLAIIMGYAEMLKDELNDLPTLSEYASEILRAGENGAKLTQKLLTFIKKTNSQSSLININDLLLEQKMMLEKTLTARINLIFDFSNDLWPVFLSHSDLENAIINMSLNAKHAMAQDAGQLTIKTKNQRIDIAMAKNKGVTEGDYVLLSISDNGNGIDTEIKEKIFDPFFSTKGEFGTGLGLSQVYGFVESSKGFIDVDSENGKGTCFNLYFPRSNKKAAT